MAGPTFAIIAAILFGLSSPLAKLLIGDISPWLLAGLLYLGSGIGMSFIQLFRRTFMGQQLQSSIKLSEVPWIAGVIIFGGIMGPVLLMYGLAQTSASTSSLLLNLEGVFTAGLAWVIFKEHFDKRIVLGMFVIILGGLILSFSGAISLVGFLGPLYVVGACLCWGIDNNLTRKISLNDPIIITAIKSLTAGVMNLFIAFVLGAKLPAVDLVLKSGLLGFVCYGLSIVCFILALRYLGASRTGAYFSMAPFVGAFVAIAFLNESLTWNFILAAFLMGIGIYLHLSESHDHLHIHEELTHEHSHTHDEHHQHPHEEGVLIKEPHSHKHTHARMEHGHAHYPDMHHQHTH